MRINVFVAQATGLSRRAADKAIESGQVKVNGEPADTGRQIKDGDRVSLNGRPLKQPQKFTTILLNKPVGYVCSRDGQGSKTVYELLPDELHRLKSIGRLDKDSTGLLLMTDDGQLANRLTHPKYQKQKTYKVTLDKALSPADKKAIEKGVMLDDGLSLLKITNYKPYPLDPRPSYIVKMSEGRNRQVRRTFQARGYKVISLHRVAFGDYQLNDLAVGKYKVL